MRLAGIIAGVLFLAFAAPGTAPAQDSSYIKLPNADPKMEAAKAKARATLAQFWEKLERPGPGEEGFALKVSLPYSPRDTEHIWTKDVERKDGRITGVINNRPRDVKTVRLGQRIEISEDQISDWMFIRNGKMVGNYTLRPLLERMPPAEAARYRAMLEEP
jgi:uncharacterized protein YegJ (DUF2314 family)